MFRQSVLPERVCEQAVVPLPGVWVEHTVQRLLGDGLRVDHVRHALDTLQPLQCLVSGRQTLGHATLDHALDTLQPLQRLGSDGLTLDHATPGST